MLKWLSEYQNYVALKRLRYAVQTELSDAEK